MSSWQTSSKPLSAFGVGYPDACWGLPQGIRAAHGYSSEELRAIDWAKTLTPLEWLR